MPKKTKEPEERDEESQNNDLKKVIKDSDSTSKADKDRIGKIIENAKKKGWDEEQVKHFLDAAKKGKIKLGSGDLKDTGNGKKKNRKGRAESKSPNVTIIDKSDGVEVKPDICFNPLFDFINIDGKYIAIQSSLYVKQIEKEGTIEDYYYWHSRFRYEDGSTGTTDYGNFNGIQAVPSIVAGSMKTVPFLHRNMESRKNENARIKDVFDHVLHIVKQHLTLKDESDYIGVSVWIVATHFIPVFNAFPPLIFSKPGFGAGGSTALIVMSLSAYPFMIFDPTEAVLFRLGNGTYGTKLIDEVKDDGYSREKIANINLILEGSFNKGLKIPRATGKGFSIELFDPYCGKVIIDPHESVISPAVHSRTFRVAMVNDKKRSESLSVAEFTVLNQDLIQSLYSLYLKYAHDVRNTYDMVTTYSGRSRQAYSPLIAVAEMVGHKEGMVKALSGSIENLEMVRNQSDPIKFVLAEVLKYLEESKERDSLIEGIWHETVDKQNIVIELKNLRKTISERAMEIHQIDSSFSVDKHGNQYPNVREWKKLPPEIKSYLEIPNKFSQILRDNLPEFVKDVRGGKYGLKLPKDKPYDAIVQQLRNILGISENE